jgi:tetratricopeptide (TPR) repeat protein
MAHTYSPGDEPVPGSGYRLVQFLGRGGFGQVWKATAPGGTEAALKIIALGGKEGRKEFRALQLVKKIRHPNLVPFFAFWLKGDDGSILDDSLAGQDDLPSAMLTPAQLQKTMVVDKPVGGAQPVELIIAMGLGDKSLFDRLEECQGQGLEGIPEDELLDYMEKAAEAIDFLNRPTHNLGSGPVAIQHCDIKPHNLMIVGGATQVCDFGLARMMGTERATTAAATVAYAAPECLVEGKPSDTTDQYSLAVTYYELKTGKLPYTDETLMAVMDAKRQGKLDFSSAPAEAAVLRRATAAKATDRFPSALEMVRQLRRAGKCEKPSGKPSGRRAFRYVLVLAALAAIAVIGRGVMLRYKRTGPETARPVAVQPETGRTETARSETAKSKAEKTPPTEPEAIEKANPAEAAFLRAVNLEQKGEYVAAIADYSEAIDLRPDYGEARLGRGRCYLKTQQYDAAIADLEPLDPERYKARGELAAACLARGTRSLSEKKYDLAVPDLEKAAINDPRDSRIYSRLGAAYFALKKYDNAVVQLTAALRLDPNDTDYLNRGRAYLRLKKTKEAADDFSEAVRLKPGNAAAFAARGNARMDLEDLDGAVADFTKTIEICESSSDANYTIVNAYILRTTAQLMAGRLDAAAGDLTEVLRVGDGEDRSSIHDLLQALASAYADEKKMRQAADWMKKAVDAAPDEDTKTKYQAELDKYRSALSTTPEAG